MNNLDDRNIRNKENVQKNRTGIVVLSVLTIAILTGFLFALPREPATTAGQSVVGTTVANNVTPSGSTEAAIAPAAGETTATTATTATMSPSASTTTTGTAAMTTDTTTTGMTPSASTSYATEAECRSGTSGTCQPAGNGWQSVSPSSQTNTTATTPSTTDTTTTTAAPAAQPSTATPTTTP